MFTWTAFDRLKYLLSRLTYGMVSWRGLDARKLAAQTSATGRTAVVVACRFPPGFKGSHATTEWRRVRMRIGDTEIPFELHGTRKPRVIDVPTGRHRLRVEHDGPPPSFETDFDIEAGQTLLVEVLPERQLGWTRFQPARLRVRSGNRLVVAAHDL